MVGAFSFCVVLFVGPGTVALVTSAADTNCEEEERESTPHYEARSLRNTEEQSGCYVQKTGERSRIERQREYSRRRASLMALDTAGDNDGGHQHHQQEQQHRGVVRRA